MRLNLIVKRSGAWAVASVVLLAAMPGARPAMGQDERGKYFAKKQYTPNPLPKFAELKAQLPSPVYDENPLWVQMYWKAWELAFRNFHEPAPGSGFVSQFIDAAFNQNVFLWDTCFMVMFTKYADPLVPAVCSLDNFYARQHEDGEICREIDRTTGADYVEWINETGGPIFSRWGWHNRYPHTGEPVKYVGRSVPQPNPKVTLDALNHPILAWAELDSYRLTGDRARLRMVWEPLCRYYSALQTYLRQGNGLYMADWASMDNSPRNIYLVNGGMGVDISSEMVLLARQLAEIGKLTGRNEDAERYAGEADALAGLINAKMWDPVGRFYYDLALHGERAPVKTVAAYWPLLAKLASPEQARALMAELANPKTFGRFHRVPTCSASESGYTDAGGYWRGAVWVPTNTMVIRGLENYGNSELARELALEHLDRVAGVFQRTGTIWENYAPDSLSPGDPARRDFVGWSGLGPIAYLLEYAVGLKADAARNEIEWRLTSLSRAGCERFRFNRRVVTLVAERPAGGKRKVLVESDGPFRLHMVPAVGGGRSFGIRAGRRYLTLDWNDPRANRTPQRLVGRSAAASNSN